MSFQKGKLYILLFCLYRLCFIFMIVKNIYFYFVRCLIIQLMVDIPPQMSMQNNKQVYFMLLINCTNHQNSLQISFASIEKCIICHKFFVKIYDTVYVNTFLYYSFRDCCFNILECSQQCTTEPLKHYILSVLNAIYLLEPSLNGKETLIHTSLHYYKFQINSALNIHQFPLIKKKSNIFWVCILHS